jgi:hypothetical protein
MRIPLVLSITLSALSIINIWGADPTDVLLDEVSLGQTDSEQGHRLTTSGRVPNDYLATVLGARSRSDSVRILAEEGSCFSCNLNAGGGDSPLLLEIQEIHIRHPQVFGYTVEVNGTEVYFRTYREVGTGPNHYFIDVPRHLAPDGRMNVTFYNQGEAPVAIGHIWAYGDFTKLAQTDQTWRPMGMLAEAQVLVGWVGKPGKMPTFEEQWNMLKDRDPEAWQELRKFFRAGSALSPGFQTTCHYLGANGADLQTEIDNAIRKAGSNGLQWQFKFMGGDWGGHPSLLDGHGGDFYDLRYSQAVYDPVTKRYSPTWPLAPGGTIWPTAGAPTLNRFIVDRTRLTARMVGERVGLLSAQGIRPTDICLVGDEGPSYWWEGGFGDFSPEMVASAARDGVKLDPEHLTPEARKWMFDILTVRFAERCRAIAEGLGRDVIAVDQGTIHLPITQLADAVYSHPFMNQVFPQFDPQWEGWQNGVNDHAWVGGEPLEYVNPSFADYIASQGSLAMVNLYRPILDIPYLDKLYQWGMGHIACYGEFSGDAKIFSLALKGVDDRLSLPARHYQRHLVDLNFSRMTALDGESPVAHGDNLVLSETLSKTLTLVDPNKPGRLVLRLDGNGKALPKDLSVLLDFGRAKKNEQASQVRILAGTDSESLHEVAVMPAEQFSRTTSWPHLCTAEISLGKILQETNRGYVAIELITPKGATETGLCRVSVQSAWTRASGQLVGNRPTNRDLRTRRLWLQDRAITERLLARHRAAGGTSATLAEAERLLACGQANKAHQLLSGAHSLLLPARFAVRGKGQLGPYPITVAWQDAQAVGLVELRQVTRSGMELALQGDTALSAEIRCGGLEPLGRYAVQDEDGRIRLVADPAGTLTADTSGWATTTTTVMARAPFGGDGFLAKNTGRVPGRRLIALCTGKDRYEVQDPTLAVYNPLRINSTTTVILERRADIDDALTTKTEPSSGDRVEIILDDAGQAIALRSTFGAASGTIRALTPPAVYPQPCNGFLELTDGRTFEFMYRHGSFTHFNVPGLQPWARNNNPTDFTAALRPGMAVKLTYSPTLIPGTTPRLITVTVPPSPETKSTP